MTLSTVAFQDIVEHDPLKKIRDPDYIFKIMKPSQLCFEMSHAISSGSLIAIQELINNGYTLHLPGPNFDASTGAFTTMLSRSLNSSQWQRIFDCWDYLLSKGIDLNYNCEGKNGSGVPLHCHAAHPEAIEYLLTHGADPLLVTSAGHSAMSSWLHAFFGMEKKGRPRAQKSLRILLDAGCDPHSLVPTHWNAKMGDPKESFLDVAYASTGQRALVPWLIEQGFDPHQTAQKKSVAQKVADKIQKGSTHRHLLAIQESVDALESQAQKQRIEQEIETSGTTKSKKM